MNSKDLYLRLLGYVRPYNRIFALSLLGTVVGLDLHLGDMNSRTLYPGLDSANELVVATGRRSLKSNLAWPTAALSPGLSSSLL